jgi:hypothetical protein
MALLQSHRGQVRAVCALDVCAQQDQMKGFDSEFASAGSDGTVRVWGRMKTANSDSTNEVHNEWVEIQCLNGHGAAVYDIATMSKNTHTQLISCSGDKTVRVWTSRNCSPWVPTLVMPTLHGGSVTAIAISILVDEDEECVADIFPPILLVTASDDGTARVWRLEDRNRYERQVRRLRFALAAAVAVAAQGVAAAISAVEAARDACEKIAPTAAIHALPGIPGNAQAVSDKPQAMPHLQPRRLVAKLVEERSLYDAFSDDQLRRMCASALLDSSGPREALLARLIAQ